MTIPEIAAQKVNTILSEANYNNGNTIFLMGSKSVGKTTLLYSFLEKAENPRETLVLEYHFSRKSSQKQRVEKTVCHLWEYGGKFELLKDVLPCIPIHGKLYFCILLDLSKFKRFWDILESAFKHLNENTVKENTEVIIICGKYDLFKNYDCEIKKHVCMTLRSVALLHNAHLLFYSNKEPQLVKRVKDLLHNIGIGGNNVVLREKNVTNYTKPLFINKGTDSWEGIGTTASTFEQIKTRHITRFMPEVNEDIIKTETVNSNTYPEPILDSLAALKMEEFYHLNVKNTKEIDC